jgi:hypothetical protein
MITAYIGIVYNLIFSSICFFSQSSDFLKLNPESALDFVTKLNYSIKEGAHGLFLKMQYFCILNFKIGESSEAYLELQCII